MSPTKMNKGLTLFGIVVFVIGLFCASWREHTHWYQPWEYPYWEIGLILTVVGIVLIVIGLVFRRKT